MPLRLVVAGATGWVGRALVAAITAAPDLELVGAVARSRAGEDAGLASGLAPTGVTLAATLDEALAVASDVVIDYTKPHVVKGHALTALAGGRHVVIGTSGLTADDYEEIDAAAKAAGRGVIAAGNFSITATLLRKFALEAARLVPDVEIIDYASPAKPDVPSGTGRELAEALSAIRRPGTSKPVDELTGLKETRGATVARPTPIQIHSVRMPSFVLSCEAIFGAPEERLVIRHDAGSSAAPYVGGTLLAARKVVERVGLTRGMETLLG